MERLELALRRYQQIIPRPVSSPQVPQRLIDVWLAEEVVPVLEDYCGRPRFREFATWPVRSLVSGAGTPERALIERIDNLIQNTAQSITALADDEQLQRKLRELNPPQRIPTRRSIELSEHHLQTTVVEHTMFDDLGLLLAQVREMSRRDWHDLVNKDDYFEPQQEWVPTDDGHLIQRADWIVALNAELLPVGGFVVRCLLKRVTMRYEMLEKLRRLCLVAVRRLEPERSREQLDLVEANWTELARNRELLEHSLRSGPDSMLRDACIAATQIHLACHPLPDLSWLDLDDQHFQRYRGTLRERMRGHQCAQMLDRVAASLNNLKTLYSSAEQAESAAEQAIASGGLVVLSGLGQPALPCSCLSADEFLASECSQP